MQATWNLLTAEDKVWLLTGKRRCGGTEPSMRRFQQFGLQQQKAISTDSTSNTSITELFSHVSARYVKLQVHA